MKIGYVLAAVIVSVLPGVACDSSNTYPVRFVCEPGGEACPRGSECPELPLSADTCGDLPGLFGHPPTSVTKGRPIGCMVSLSYGNPYYADTQQECTCDARVSSNPSDGAAWACPI
jgi:hypothetical protein